MIAKEQAGSSSYAVWPWELRVSTHDIIGFVKTNTRCSTFCPRPIKFAAYELKATATGRMSWPLSTAPPSGCQFLSALNCAAFAPARTTQPASGRQHSAEKFQANDGLRRPRPKRARNRFHRDDNERMRAFENTVTQPTQTGKSTYEKKRTKRRSRH